MDEKKSCATNYTDGINYHQLCITEDMWCDGIPQCPDLSDEDLKECTKYFPTNSMDVNACEAANIFNNVTIYTRPVRCNAIIECRNDSDDDEANCRVDNGFPDAMIIIALVILFGISVFTVMSVGILEKCEKGNLVERFATDMEPGTLANIQPLIVVNQGTKQQKSINQSFMRHLNKLHENDYSLILRALKVVDELLLLEAQNSRKILCRPCLTHLLRQKY